MKETEVNSDMDAITDGCRESGNDTFKRRQRHFFTSVYDDFFVREAEIGEPEKTFRCDETVFTVVGFVW